MNLSPQQAILRQGLPITLTRQKVLKLAEGPKPPLQTPPPTQPMPAWGHAGCIHLVALAGVSAACSQHPLDPLGGTKTASTGHSPHSQTGAVARFPATPHPQTVPHHIVIYVRAMRRISKPTTL